MIRLYKIVVPIILLVGVIVVVLTMKQSTFSSSTEPLTNEQRTSPPGENVLPPLDVQISSADMIVRAQTVTDKGEIKYKTLEVLRAEVKNDLFNIGALETIDLNMFQQLGYPLPHDQQEVIFFFNQANLVEKRPFEFLVVTDNHVTYGEKDPVVRQTLTVDELKQKIREAKK